MYRMFIIPDPIDGRWTLTLDNGTECVGQRSPHPSDPMVQAVQFNVPDDAPNKNGASLLGVKEGYLDESYHGFLFLNEPSEGLAALMIDIFHMVQLVEPAPIPPPGTDEPDPNANPLEIINHVFNSTNPNLSTAAGCGKFTEDCCRELHEKMHPAWGHVKKTGAQNQYNGHAVDAVMLLVPSGGTAPAIYDIIQSSAGPDAKPAFNYADPVDNSLWYYPAAPLGSKSPESVTVWRTGKK